VNNSAKTSLPFDDNIRDTILRQRAGKKTTSSIGSTSCAMATRGANALKTWWEKERNGEKHTHTSGTYTQPIPITFDETGIRDGVYFRNAVGKQLQLGRGWRTTWCCRSGMKSGVKRRCNRQRKNRVLQNRKNLPHTQQSYCSS